MDRSSCHCPKRFCDGDGKERTTDHDLERSVQRGSTVVSAEQSDATVVQFSANAKATTSDRLE